MANDNSNGWMQAAVGSAGGLFGSIATNIANKKRSKEAQQWNEKMYAMQRADALSDWNMQNAYNSPEQQMQRLKDAGLNPNLVYGNGATATSNQDVRSSNAGSPTAIPADYSGAGNSIMSFVDMKAKTAQTDNIKVQNALIREQVRSQQMDNASKALTYVMEAQAKNASNSVVAQLSMERAKKELYNLAAQGDVLDAQAGSLTQSALLKGSQYNTEMVRRKNMVDENTRAWISNSTSVKEAAARIVSMAVANAKSDAERQLILKRTTEQKFQNFLKMKEAEYYKRWNRSNPNDNQRERLVDELLNKSGDWLGVPLY